MTCRQVTFHVKAYLAGLVSHLLDGPFRPDPEEQGKSRVQQYVEGERNGHDRTMNDAMDSL